MAQNVENKITVIETCKLPSGVTNRARFVRQQILNQPLAPQTLMLLNQLLQHIKMLQGLLTQQQMLQAQNPQAKPNSTQALLHNTVQISKTKQQITSLQVRS